jgi:3-hydroxyisobutyrate dehydrogenase-like beta-hydroxyacid dehydrogenase
MQDEKGAAMKIGFIGLGYMGSAIAKVLVDADHDLSVYDIRPEAVGELEKLGARAATSPADATSGSECTFTMVLNDEQTDTVIFGEKGVFSAINQGILVVLSTITPQHAREIASRMLKEKGIPVIDAPVSGVPGAAGGTMITMVGGPPEVVERYLPLLKTIAKEVFYCGESGSGAVAKFTNALIWEISWSAVHEGLKLGKQMGLKEETLLKIYNQATAGCWATRNWHWVKEMMESPGPLALEYKDMKLVIDFAREHGVETPILDLCYMLGKTEN